MTRLEYNNTAAALVPAIPEAINQARSTDVVDLFLRLDISPLLAMAVNK